MKKFFIRSVSAIVLAWLLICGFAISAPSVNAAVSITEEEFAAKIETYKKEYPHGKYWCNSNGTVSSGNYKGTSLVGTKSCGSTVNSLASSCGRLVYKGTEYAYQCHGYALWLGQGIFGTFYHIDSNWSKINGVNGVYSGEIYAGDIVRMSSVGHTYFVYKVEGDTLYYTDCNYVGPCKIRWGTKKIADAKKDISFVAHYKGNTLKGTGDSKPVLTMQYNINGGVIENRYKVTTDGAGLWLRSSASTNGSKLVLVEDGKQLVITETKSAGGYTWGKTTYEGKTGWCAVSDGLTERVGYYTDSSGKIYAYSTNGLATTNWKYGTGETSGLYNQGTFGISKEGYTFVGWSLSKDGSTAVFGQDDSTLKAETIDPTFKDQDKTVVLNAIWKANITTSVAVITEPGNEVLYTTLKQACNEQEGYIQLRSDFEESISIQADKYLDLNGYTLNGDITIAANATLYVFDSATADYAAEDRGSIIGNITGSLSRSFNTPQCYGRNYKYMVVREADGSYSSHRYYLAVKSAVLSPCREKSGYTGTALDYKTVFKCNSVMAQYVTAYGARLVGENTVYADYLTSGYILKTGANQDNEQCTRLADSLKTTNTEQQNMDHAQRVVTVGAFLRLNDGLQTEVVSGNVNCSILEIIRRLDNLTPMEQAAMDVMYRLFPYLKDAVQ